MDSTNINLNEDERLELIKYGSLISTKLRNLLPNSNPNIINNDLIIDTKIKKQNKDQNPIDLNLDLTNYINKDTTIDNSIVYTNNNKNTNKSTKLNEKELIKEWFNIKEKEITPEILREWKSIQLRGFIDPKKFYKNNKTLEPIPNKYNIGYIINPNTVLNVNNNTSSTVNKRKRKNLITNMLNDSHKFINKRYNEIQKEKTRGSKGWYKRQLLKRSTKSKFI